MSEHTPFLVFPCDHGKCDGHQTFDTWEDTGWCNGGRKEEVSPEILDGPIPWMRWVSAATSLDDNETATYLPERSDEQ